MINPMKFMQVKSMLATLKQNHPKFPSFLDAVSKRALCKDTIIEIKVTTPDGESLESNLRLKESDLEVLRQMQELRKRKIARLIWLSRKDQAPLICRTILVCLEKMRKTT